MKSVFVNCYSFLIFIYLMFGVHAWFVWTLEDRENGKYYLLAMFLLFCLNCIYFFLRKVRLSRARNTVIGLIFLFIAFEICYGFSMSGLLLGSFFIFSLWILLSDTIDYDRIIRNVLRILVVILIPGIILYLYMILKDVLLPGIPFIHPNNSYYYYFNYLFLLRDIGSSELDGFRFQSICLESGFLGTFIAFLLYTIRFDFKKYRSAYILLISLLLSMSLAGYVLGLLGFVLNQWSKRKRITFIIPIGFLLLFLYLIAISYKNGDNYIYTRIVERFEYDEEKGIKGNNRVGAGTDYYFEKSILDGSFVFGLGTERISKINGGKGWEEDQDYNNQIRGAGYKVFILYNGIVAAILYLLGYYYIGVKGNSRKRYSMGYFIIIIITFLQAAYFESYSWIIPFILGTNNEELVNCNNKS